MKKTKTRLLAILALMLSPMAANADLISLEFTATDILTFSGATPSPENPVTGVLVYEAAGIGATIDSLVSFDMTIDGFLYSLADIGFQSPFGSGSIDIIYGAVGGLGVTTGTDDFWLRWDRISGSAVDLLFTSSNTPGGAWQVTNFQSFSISTVSVPEPSTLALFGLGLLGLGFARRRA